MKLKMVDGQVEVRDGKPVYVRDDGSEVAFDAPKAMADFKERRDEFDNLKRQHSELTTKVAGLDLDAARAALTTVANLRDQKLIEAGKVDEVVAERLKQHTEKSAQAEQALKDQIKAIEANLYQATVGREFAASKLLAEKTFLPPRAAQALWGDRFKVQDGAIVAIKKNGETLYGADDPNKPAPFDEALDFFIKEDADRDRYLKGTNNGGGGSMSTTTKANGAPDLSKLPAAEKLAWALDHPNAKAAAA